jgi:methionine-rich copper-binding protein CopC
MNIVAVCFSLSLFGIFVTSKFLGAKRRVMHPGHRFFLAVCSFAAVAMFSMVGPAAAHAILLESSPSIHSMVAGPGIPIKLRFNVRIDATRSRLTLVRPDASTQLLVIAKDSPADTLQSHGQGLSPGEYRIRWQVLASDGHITRGEIPFQVTQP